MSHNSFFFAFFEVPTKDPLSRTMAGMLKSAITSVLFVLLTLICFHKASTNKFSASADRLREDSSVCLPFAQSGQMWDYPLYMVINEARQMVHDTKKMMDSPTEEESVMYAHEIRFQLSDLTKELGRFRKTDPSAREEGCAGIQPESRYLTEEESKPTIDGFFQNSRLQTNYETRYRSLTRALKEDLDRFFETKDISEMYSFPLDKVCANIPQEDETLQISIDDVCPTTTKCAGALEPHPYGDQQGTSVQTACTDADQCDVAEAFPMMVALLWYKVTDWIVQRLCIKQVQQGEGHLDSNYDAILREIQRLMGFVNTLPVYDRNLRTSIFQMMALQRKAYSSVDAVISIVETTYYKDYLKTAAISCNELHHPNSCPLADIYKEYVCIKRLRKNRLERRKTHDLRFHKNVNSAKLIELQQDSLNHFELLENIQSLDQNLRTHVKGISAYFRGIAKYDEGIANADVMFIQGELDKFDVKFGALAKRVETDLKAIMNLMKTGLELQFAEELMLLGVEILQSMMPNKIFFGGIDFKDMLEQAQEVGRAGEELSHGGALIVAFMNVVQDSESLAHDLNDNAKQIAHLRIVVEKITNNQIDSIDSDADLFIEEYGNYTPKIAKPRLAENDAMWAVFKSTACDLLNDAQGVGATMTKGVANIDLLCENLEGSLAEYFTLRENIFDFQFELVDAVARVVRGNVAKKLADSLTYSKDNLHANQLMRGFLMAQIRLQSQASLYCEILEYKQQGRQVDVCLTKDGHFNKRQLETLIAYSDNSPHDTIDRYAYIPTRPQFPGDTGFINLPALGRGEKVTFRLPMNSTWLRDYYWIVEGERGAPFVQEFKLFLPPTDATQFKTTRITVR